GVDGGRAQGERAGDAREVHPVPQREQPVIERVPVRQELRIEGNAERVGESETPERGEGGRADTHRAGRERHVLERYEWVFETVEGVAKVGERRDGRRSRRLRKLGSIPEHLASVDVELEGLVDRLQRVEGEEMITPRD